MYKIKNTENKDFNDFLKKIVKDIYDVDGYKILEENEYIDYFPCCDFDECDEAEEHNLEVKICLPIFEKPTLKYIPYDIIFIGVNVVYVENDYLEVESYISELRNCAFSKVQELLSDNDIEFLEEFFEISIDEIFWDINNGSIESIYTELFDRYEDNGEEMPKNMISIVEKFNSQLIKEYNNIE